MPQDFDKALDSLKEMLSTEDGKQNLGNIIGSFAGGMDMNTNQEANQLLPSYQPNTTNSGGLESNLLLGMKKVMDELGNNNTQSANLLSALRPYLSTTRYKNVDTAIQIMKLSKLPGAFKNFKK